MTDPAKPLPNWAHRLKHAMGMHPVELIEIIHAPECIGDCIVERWKTDLTWKPCDHKLRLRCKQCGKEEVI